MTDRAMTQLWAALQRARRAGQVAEITLADLPVSAQQAYEMVRTHAPEVVAWKIGGANPWSRQVFNNKEIFFGPLHQDELAFEGNRLSLRGLVAPLAEPEVMLEIADWTAQDPAARFSRVGLGFEIPAAVLPEALKPELMGQIADRAGAGALWIGATRSFDPALLETPLTVDMVKNGDAPVSGSTQNVITGPLGAAAEFLALAARHEMPLATGQWIATGGLCPAVPVQPGDTLALHSAWGALDLQLE